MDAKHWQDIEKDWKFYFDEGKSYLDTCKKLIMNKASFDNEFIYNLSILGGERLVLGTLLSYNYIPSSSSLSGMLEEGKSYYDLKKELLEGASYLNQFQQFCSLEVVPLIVPNDKELKTIIEYMTTVEIFCDKNINTEAVLA